MTLLMGWSVVLIFAFVGFTLDSFLNDRKLKHTIPLMIFAFLIWIVIAFFLGLPIK